MVHLVNQILQLCENITRGLQKRNHCGEELEDLHLHVANLIPYATFSTSFQIIAPFYMKPK